MHNPLGGGFFIFMNNRDIGKIKSPLDDYLKK